jgi:hypothetical protein
MGSRLQVILETQMTAIVVGFPSMPDSTEIQSSWRTVTTQRVSQLSGTDRLISGSLDSSRARSRLGTGAREEVLLAGVQGLRGRWIMSDRLQVTGLAGGQSGDGAFMDALTATTAGLSFALPEAPVPVGGEWSGPFRFPLGAHLTASGKVASSGSIGGVATAVLDSLVARARDTLAYITVRAVASPTTLPFAAEGGIGSATFTGGFAAGLVWSTGWNAVVSGATNARVTGTVSIQRADGSPVNGALTLNISARHQVRL